MFKFDQVALPQLLLRKALIIVDFQQDFVGTNAAIPINLPEGYVGRTVRLAKAFRRIGDVVWVNSKFEEVRPPYDAHMENLASGENDSKSSASSPDAFLSHEKAECVLSSKIGAEVPQNIKDDAEKKDTFLLKSHYSAFEGTGLLRFLRARMTMEIYICGSLINAGVYATTVDAAGHGFAITLVNDCCGYSSEARQIKAIEALQALTGCGFSASTKIVKDDSPNQAGVDKNSSLHGDEIVQSMSALTLKNATTAPQAAEPDARGELREAVDNAQHQIGTIPTDISPEDTAINKFHDHRAPMNRSKSGDMSEGQEGQQLRGLCEGDTDVIENLLPIELESGIFEILRDDEVQWQRMSHQGGEVPRLVAVQGEVGSDGSMPVYRHPSDESPPLLPFSSTVLAIKAVTEKQLGHPLNHVLIQFYQNGKDYISEHSDKTLDIMRDSYIANVSLGAKRTMVLRTKRTDKDSLDGEQHTYIGGRKVQRAPLPHNSLCRMGLETNMKWLHSIRQDKRLDREKSPEELAYGGGRISLTFRHIGTFLDKDGKKIWGQGATAKCLDNAKDVINGQTEESISMLRAFGTENHSSDFDWNAHYGKGFDVLHLRGAPRLFLSTDSIVNMKISMMLAFYEIGYASGSISQSQKSTSQHIDDERGAMEDVFIKYVDNDDDKTEVSGDLAIMLYLHANYQKKKGTMTSGELAKQFTLFQNSISLLRRWRDILKIIGDSETLIITLNAELKPWEAWASDTDCIGGNRPNLVDFALWPVLYSMVERCGNETFTDLIALRKYYDTMKTRSSTMKMLHRLQQAQ